MISVHIQLLIQLCAFQCKFATVKCLKSFKTFFFKYLKDDRCNVQCKTYVAKLYV